MGRFRPSTGTLAFSPSSRAASRSTSQNFARNGAQYVLEQRGGPGAPLVETARFDAADGPYDCRWSEENESVLVSASATAASRSGTSPPPTANAPIAGGAHARGGQGALEPGAQGPLPERPWDDTVVVVPAGPPASGPSRSTLPRVRGGLVAAARRHLRRIGDCTLKVFDARRSSARSRSRRTSTRSQRDWNKYNDCVVATGSGQDGPSVGHPLAEAGAGHHRGHRGRARRVLRPRERICGVHVFV